VTIVRPLRDGSHVRAQHGSRSWWRHESLLHVGAAIVGAGSVVALVGTATAPLLLRSGALAAAFTLVVRGLVLLLHLGRAEWRREGPATSAYGRVGARFLIAFILAGLATT
jgi:hypothetical protein